MPFSPPQGNRDPHLIIKICGIRSIEDAVTAAENGADMIGIMRVEKSPRYLALDEAKSLAEDIRKRYPSLNLVTVMADMDAQRIEETILTIKPQLAQFHGSESESFCQKFGISYIKAIRATDSANIQKQASLYPSASYLLLDSVGAGFGGSGQTFDWKQIPPKLAKRMIIAGGLNPDNLGELLNKYRDRICGVDVSSGVESRPGIKDPAKISSFLSTAREVNH